MTGLLRLRLPLATDQTLDMGFPCTQGVPRFVANRVGIEIGSRVPPECKVWRPHAGDGRKHGPRGEIVPSNGHYGSNYSNSSPRAAQRRILPASEPAIPKRSQGGRASNRRTRIPALARRSNQPCASLCRTSRNSRLPPAEAKPATANLLSDALASACH